MTHRHRHTLEKLFAHPIPTDLKWSRVVGLICGLGASAQATSRSHMKFQLPNASELTVPIPRHDQISSREELAAIRSYLEQNNVTPDHPEYTPRKPELDGTCMLLHLAHQESSLYTVETDGAEVHNLRPYDPWFHRHHLDHRKEASFEGQRAPEQPAYFKELRAASRNADQLLIVGHGDGRTDLRALFLQDLATHDPELLKRVVDVLTVDEHLTEPQLLALARETFGAPAMRS